MVLQDKPEVCNLIHENPSAPEPNLTVLLGSLDEHMVAVRLNKVLLGHELFLSNLVPLLLFVKIPLSSWCALKEKDLRVP